MPGPIPSPHAVSFSDKRPKPVSDNIVPKAPTWLTKEAKHIYKQTAKRIVQLGIAGSADENVLALFAMQTARLIKISKKADEENLSEARMLNDLTAQTLSLMKELGLTPSSRAKLRIAKITEEDPLKELMNDE